MKVLDIFSYAWGGIRLRKLRAALTTLGVVIGIAAIVALLSLGEGFRVEVTSQFERGFALNTLNVIADRGFGFGMGGSASDFYLVVNDTRAINQIEGVSMAAAIISKSVSIASGSRTRTVTVVGVNFTQYSEIYSSTFLAGDGLIPLSPTNDTIVLGVRVADPWKNGTLFAKVGDDIHLTWTTGPVSKPIIKSYVFHVAAVLKEIGGFSIGGPSDNQVYIPITTAQSVFNTDQCSQIVIQLVDSNQATIDSVTETVEKLFDNKVTVIRPTAVLDTVSSVFSVIELFLAGIAGISLLVAGIGIMNIMIVSVLERTREIGILKSLGMKDRTVLIIFLGEAALIGLMGAVIGITLGWGLANVVSRFSFTMMGGAAGGGQTAGTRLSNGLSITPVLTPSVLVGALAFGVATSVLFGLYPARRASKLNPVEALRHE
ncbi:MAG: FtsX-like permease family protein [Candidatus Hadarchaeum sp.]